MESTVSGLIRHPSCAILTGMSGSGKSTWMGKLLLHRKIFPSPDRIVWFYMQYQPLYDDLLTKGLNIEFIRGLPSEIKRPEFFDRNLQNVCIFDDLFLLPEIDKIVADFFIHASAHRNTSCFYLVHNLYWKSPLARAIRLNTKYLIAFRSASDKEALLRIGRQIFPRQMDYYNEALEYALAKPHSYIIIDMHASTPDNSRLLTDIFGENQNKLPVLLMPR